MELHRWLGRGDLLIFNNTRVLPARLFGRFEPGGGACELLLLRRVAPHVWRCMGRPLKKFRSGTSIALGGALQALVRSRCSDYEVELEFSALGQDADAALRSQGIMPIPPYIRTGHGDEQDREDYQTIFASAEGSVAAPTAGLHFSPELMEALTGAGVESAYLTLHVGAASFLSLLPDPQSSELSPPGAEIYFPDPQLLARINAARAGGGRIIAVGTTTVRALESMFRSESQSTAAQETSLFITPGFEFRAVDAVITNFHQPYTTHLLLVEALMGRALLERSYRFALEHAFRFLSYGDGMLIL